ncbi:hypothetical protein glysoja_038225 [Glycine soja]|uniref:Ankyrin repeat-containing protein n=1 Tax=Glycine soja TaxID=3848 RepID=A0A0B2R1R7_GLYSO|nr:hypothetical protein glysoja_038225 [Glycine soja]
MSPEDMLIRNLYGTLPVHLAILYGRNEMVQILLSQEVLDKMDSEDIERLFFMTIRVDMFDCAMQLFEKHPTDLAIARNEEQLTALHMLARKPPKILGGNKESKADELLQKLWTQVNQLPREWIMNLITHPWSVQFEAVKSGNVEALMILIDKNRELLTIKDPENGRNLLHLVVLFRQERMFRRIFGYEDRIIAVEVDNQGNNILHFAAHLPVEFQELSSLRASIQMQRELEWFQFVELQVPLELRIMRNNMGRRPIDVFYEEHKKLSEEIKDAGKGISESGMLVAALVATRFAESEFVISLHPSLTFGPVLIFISFAAMVVVFTAASFLIIDHTSKWVSYAVASIGVFPILLFLLFQFNLFDFLWYRYYGMPKVQQPTSKDFHIFKSYVEGSSVHTV